MGGKGKGGEGMEGKEMKVKEVEGRQGPPIHVSGYATVYCMWLADEQFMSEWPAFVAIAICQWYMLILKIDCQFMIPGICK